MPPRKRPEESRVLQRNGRQKLRGRRGSLEAMPGIPLDVIIEILSYLHPRDILSLARTSKPFRALLMDRRNAFIWRAARTALPGGLPDPHPLMSEPALAFLMFNSQCHNCGRGPVHKVVWLWLKRYCCKCLPKMTWATRYVKERLQAIGLGRIQGSDFRAIANFVSPEHDDQDEWSDEYNHFHALQVMAFEWQWLNASNSLATLTALYSERKVRVQAEIKLAAQLKKWAKEDRERREQENRQVREERFADVLRRLREAGWGPELDYCGSRIRWDSSGPARDLYTRRIVLKLTDKAWPKVHDSLKGFMASLRRDRFAEAQQEAVDEIDAEIASRCTRPIPHTGSSCYLHHGGPTALDIVWMPEVADLFVDPGSASDVVTGLKAVVPRIQQLVVQWEEHLKTKLREKVFELCPDVSINIDPLELAVAVFSCGQCESRFTEFEEAAPVVALRYSDVLSHGCFRRHDSWDTSDSPLPIAKEYQRTIIELERLARPDCPRCPLLPDRILMIGAQRACAALLKVNCDPNVVTYAEMQTWDRREGLLVPPSAETRRRLESSHYGPLDWDGDWNSLINSVYPEDFTLY